MTILTLVCFVLYIIFITSLSLPHHLHILSTFIILCYTEHYIILITSPNKHNLQMAKAPENIPGIEF